jgi:hypothetical protein
MKVVANSEPNPRWATIQASICLASRFLVVLVLVILPAWPHERDNKAR